MSISTPIRVLPRVQLAKAGSSSFTTSSVASPSSKPAISTIALSTNASSLHTTSPACRSIRSNSNAIDAELELGECIFGAKDYFSPTISGARSITGHSSASVYSASPETTRARSSSHTARFVTPMTKHQLQASEIDLEYLPAVAPLDSLMTSDMGWTNVVDAEISDITSRALADVYGEPRRVEAHIDVANHTLQEVTAMAPVTVEAVTPARDLAAEEAALWAAAKQCHTEDFDDAYIKERQRRRQESDGRPLMPDRPVVNRAELFADSMHATASTVTHVFYEAPTASTVYDCDRSPQCRVPAKPEQETPATTPNTTE